MSADSIAEKVSSLPMSQGKARCRLSQLRLRCEWMQSFISADGEPFEVRTRMGPHEWWRVVDGGTKDPMVEAVEP